MGEKKKHEVFESTFVLEFEEGKDRRPTMGFCGGSFEMIGNAPWSCMEDDSRRPESCWRRGTLRLVSHTVVLASGRSCVYGCLTVVSARTRHTRHLLPVSLRPRGELPRPKSYLENTGSLWQTAAVEEGQENMPRSLFSHLWSSKIVLLAF